MSPSPGVSLSQAFLRATAFDEQASWYPHMQPLLTRAAAVIEAAEENHNCQTIERGPRVDCAICDKLEALREVLK